MPGAPTIVTRRPALYVTSRGSAIPDVQLDASWNYEFGKPAEATVQLNRLPSWLDFWAPITIAAGATDSTVEVRFSGYVWDFPNYTLGARSVELAARGPLIKAQTALVSDESNDVDVPGVDLSNMTARAQVIAVLNASGLASDYSAGDIGGTADVLGTQTAEDAKGSKNPNVWKRNRSGLDFIAERDKVELGFRLCETLVPGRGLRIVRPQISPRPSLATPAITLYEGVDLERSSTAAHSSNTETYNRVVVTGYDPGGGPPKAIATAPHPKPVPGVPFITAPPLASSLIERQSPGDSGQGWDCGTVALWKLNEVNHVQLKVEAVTPNDAAFDLRHEIGVYAPDRLEVAQTMWCRSLKASLGSDGFRQRLSLRAPAALGRGGFAPPMFLSYIEAPGAGGGGMI